MRHHRLTRLFRFRLFAVKNLYNAIMMSRNAYSHIRCSVVVFVKQKKGCIVRYDTALLQLIFLRLLLLSQNLILKHDDACLTIYTPEGRDTVVSEPV